MEVKILNSSPYVREDMCPVHGYVYAKTGAQTNTYLENPGLNN